MQSPRLLPLHGWLGLALVALSWPMDWLLPGMRTNWLFFPLWLGYTLTVDGLVLKRRASSPWTRHRLAFLGLFAASVLAWWLFEAINQRTQNWVYLSEPLGTVEYALLASLSFSTVIPAVFCTAELAASFGWIRRLPRGPRLPGSRAVTLAFFAGGWVMLALLLAWPRIFFPFVWLSLYFILEPVNVWLGNRSLFDSTARRDWRPVVALWVAGLICGFFWEMWNSHSYPKWTYNVPGVGHPRLFEMPLLGYGGYLPFTMELYALYHFLGRLVGWRGAQSYLRLEPDNPPADQR